MPRATLIMPGFSEVLEYSSKKLSRIEEYLLIELPYCFRRRLEKMADDIDIEAMLEAPYKKVRKNMLVRLLYFLI